jgi:hypothetical protein
MSQTYEDNDYRELLAAVFSAPLPPHVFTTEPLPSTTLYRKSLYDLFLKRLPAKSRQHYECRACREFVEKYGFAVWLDNGKATSVFWRPRKVSPFFKHSVEDLRRYVESLPVTGRLVTKTAGWGVQGGRWKHFFCNGRVMPDVASHSEDKKLFERSAMAMSAAALSTAEHYLRLWGTSKHLDMVVWFRAAQKAYLEAIASNPSTSSNLAWDIVSKAPVGFCHIKNTCVGELCESISEGRSEQYCKHAYLKSTDGLSYQRPTSLKGGQIDAAEKLFKEIDPSILERRQATLEDVQERAIWLPRHRTDVWTSGVFSDLRTGACSAYGRVTWASFLKRLLGVVRLQYLVPEGLNSYFAFNTSVHGGHPFQWNHGVNWYMYYGGSLASRWGLRSMWTDVLGVFLQPNEWGGSDIGGHGAYFVLNGARDTNASQAGLALFPEELRAEFRPVRAVMEARSKTGRLQLSEGRLAAGVCFQDKSFNNGTAGYTFRVTGPGGHITEATVDRWE